MSGANPKFAKPPKLTPKQKLFLKFYSQGLNPTDAAIQAGYSAKDAYKRAYENLKNPILQKFIAKGAKKVIETQVNELADDLTVTLNVLDRVIGAGTTDDKLNQLAGPGHALTAISEKAKLLGMYQPEKKLNVHLDVDFEKAQRLNQLIKEKDRGY